MQNKSKIEFQKMIHWILNIVIIVLSFLFILTAGVMIEEWHSTFSPAYDEDSFYYSITDERYYDMVDGYYRNIQGGYEGNAELKEYYGVAKYFEAASLYKAYTVTDNPDMAAHFWEKMKQAESEMGSLGIAKEPISAYLGMEE